LRVAGAYPDIRLRVHVRLVVSAAWRRPCRMRNGLVVLARLQLDPSLGDDVLGPVKDRQGRAYSTRDSVGAWQLTLCLVIARALQRYGMIVSDHDVPTAKTCGRSWSPVLGVAWAEFDSVRLQWGRESWS
jgi:hypothetical protein